MLTNNHNNGQDQMLSDGNIPFTRDEAGQVSFTPAAAVHNLHRAIDSAIDQLLGYKAQLIKAQAAGLTTVDLECPDTGKLYRVGISLAIEAIDFACTVKKAGAA